MQTQAQQDTALARVYAREIAQHIERKGIALTDEQRPHYVGRWVRLNYITRSERRMQAMTRKTLRAMQEGAV